MECYYPYFLAILNCSDAVNGLPDEQKRVGVQNILCLFFGVPGFQSLSLVTFERCFLEFTL